MVVSDHADGLNITAHFCQILFKVFYRSTYSILHATGYGYCLSVFGIDGQNFERSLDYVFQVGLMVIIFYSVDSGRETQGDESCYDEGCGLSFSFFPIFVFHSTHKVRFSEDRVVRELTREC